MQATPADETVAEAIREGVVVGKQRVDVKRASVRSIAAATRAVPRERGTRGRRVSSEDAAIITKLARAIERLGLEARVAAKAGAPGKPAHVAIDVALPDLPKLGPLLSRVRAVRAR